MAAWGPGGWGGAACTQALLGTRTLFQSLVSIPLGSGTPSSRPPARPRRPSLTSNHRGRPQRGHEGHPVEWAACGNGGTASRRLHAWLRLESGLSAPLATPIGTMPIGATPSLELDVGSTGAAKAPAGWRPSLPAIPRGCELSGPELCPELFPGAQSLRSARVNSRRPGLLECCGRARRACLFAQFRGMTLSQGCTPSMVAQEYPKRPPRQPLPQARGTHTWLGDQDYGERRGCEFGPPACRPVRSCFRDGHKQPWGIELPGD